MKRIVAAVAVMAAVGAGILAYRAGWLTHLGGGANQPAAVESGAAGNRGMAAGGSVAAGGGGAGVGGGAMPAGGEPSPVPVEAIAPGGNIALLDAGGRVEQVTSDYGGDRAAPFLLDGEASTGWSSRNLELPQDIVIAFLNREPALVSGVAINPGRKGYEDQFARDVEIWVSATSPVEGFTKVGQMALRKEPVDQT